MKKVYLFLLLCVCIQLSWGQDRVLLRVNTTEVSAMEILCVR